MKQYSVALSTCLAALLLGSLSPAPAHATPPPQISVYAKPDGVTTSSTAYFLFPVVAQGGLKALDCKLDAGGFAPCWFQQYYFNLSPGAHAITIRAIDYLEQAVSVSFEWTVGTVPAVASPFDVTPPTKPDVVITSGGVSANGNGSASFSATDASGPVRYQCQIDSQPYADCVSPMPFMNLAEGRHTLRVRAADAAGNVSGEGAATLLVDRTAPRIAFTAAPSATTSARLASFSLAVTDSNGSGVTDVRCKTSDEAEFVSCETGRTIVSATAGPKSLSVRAVDAAGNLAVAEYSWVIIDASDVAAGASNPVSVGTPSPATASPPIAAPATPASRFKVFLSLSFPGVPASLPKDIGASPFNCFNQSPFMFDTVPDDSSPVPTYEKMRSGLHRMVDFAVKYSDPYWPFGDSEHLCLDWENFWNLAGQALIDVGDPSLSSSRRHLAKFATSARLFRKALNESGMAARKFGFYGVAPIDAWSTYLSTPDSSLFRRQVQAHHLPEMADVIREVDFLTTTTYLPKNPTEANWAHIENTLKLAREISQGKPVYVFAWPQYSGASGYMDDTTWLRQLDLARKYGDAVIIWASHQLPGADKVWNPHASWWKAAVRWMQAN